MDTFFIKKYPLKTVEAYWATRRILTNPSFVCPSVTFSTAQLLQREEEQERDDEHRHTKAESDDNCASIGYYMVMHLGKIL